MMTALPQGYIFKSAVSGVAVTDTYPVPAGTGFVGIVTSSESVQNPFILNGLSGVSVGLAPATTGHSMQYVFASAPASAGGTITSGGFSVTMTFYGSEIAMQTNDYNFI